MHFSLWNEMMFSCLSGNNIMASAPIRDILSVALDFSQTYHFCAGSVQQQVKRFGAYFWEGQNRHTHTTSARTPSTKNNACIMVLERQTGIKLSMGDKLCNGCLISSLQQRKLRERKIHFFPIYEEMNETMQLKTGLFI